MKGAALCFALSVAMFGCAFLRQHGRTAADVLIDLCPLLGIDPAICADAKTAQPAVDAVLAKRKAAAQRMGVAPTICLEAKP